MLGATAPSEAAVACVVLDVELVDEPPSSMSDMEEQPVTAANASAMLNALKAFPNAVAAYPMQTLRKPRLPIAQKRQIPAGSGPRRHLIDAGIPAEV